MIYGKKFSTAGKKMTILLFVFISLNIYAQDKVIFGLTGTVYKGDLQTFDYWKKYLEKKLNKKVELKFSRTYAEMRTMLDLGSVDIAYVCNSTYVKLREANNVKLLSTPISKGTDKYYSYIIAKKDNQYTKIEDFKNKIFAFTDPNSTSGSIAFRYYLLKHGEQPKNYLKKIIYTYAHGESIKAVLEDFVDGASVDSLVYEQFIKRYPENKEKLSIVQKLGPFHMSPLVATKSLDSKVFDSIQNIFLNMDKSKEGKEILKDLSLDKLSYPKKNFSQIESMMKYIQKNEI